MLSVEDISMIENYLPVDNVEKNKLKKLAVVEEKLAEKDKVFF